MTLSLSLSLPGAPPTLSTTTTSLLFHKIDCLAFTFIFLFSLVVFAQSHLVTSGFAKSLLNFILGERVLKSHRSVRLCAVVQDTLS